MIVTIIFLFIIIEYIKELITIYKKLFHEGFFIIKNYLRNKDIERVNKFIEDKDYTILKSFLLENEHFLNKIKLTLYNQFKNEQAFNYLVLDYMYILNGSSINSWHRDYTSSKLFNNLEHPAYSMILYLSKSSLEVIPSSNENDKHIYFCYKSFKKINFETGDAIIFDSDLFHKGSNNGKLAIQLKIIHKKDLHLLPNLNNYFKINNELYSPSIFNYYINEFIKYIPFLIDRNHYLIKKCFTKDNKNVFQQIITQFLFNNYKYFD